MIKIIVSIGTIGLIKAAITFDTSKEIAFSTYASRCIKNEIFMHYRKSNKYAKEISIDEPIGDDGKGNKLKLGDTIKDPKSNFIENIVNKKDFIQLVSIILNYLEEKMRLVMLYRIGEILQRDIAEKLNISQTHVSRIATKATSKIREVNNQQVHYKEVFSMAIVGDEYRLSFSSKDISNFNKIFATLLQNLTFTEKSPDFRVNCNRERIVVQIPAHPESFSFIAQIIQEIDDFSVTFVSDKSTLPADSTVSQEVDYDLDTVYTDKETLVEEPIVEDTASSSKELNTVVETDAESTVERGSKVKKLRDYMLSMSSFTVKDLKHHFPNLTSGTINNTVYLAKRKGLITATGRGKYCVNKT